MTDDVSALDLPDEDAEDEWPALIPDLILDA